MNRSNKNLLWQFGGQGVGKVFMILFYILLPVYAGVVEYGKFAFAFAVAAILIQPLVEMGLDMVIVKWVSRGGFHVIKKALFIRSAAAVISIPVLYAASVLLKISQGLLFAFLLYYLILSLQNVVFSYFRGKEHMKFEGIINPLQKAVALMMLVVVSSLGIRDARAGAFALVCSAMFSMLLLVGITGKALWEDHKKDDASSALPRYSELIREGTVLGGVVLLWLIYFRIDSVMLGLMKSDSDVGVYNVAYKIMEGLFFIPGIIMIVHFPRLAKPEQFNEMFVKLLIVLGGAGLLGSFLLYFLSGGIISLIYGPDFQDAIPVLKILSFVLFPVFLAHVTSQALVALDLNRLYFIAAFIGVLLNVSLNYLLIPRIGARGAAWSTLVTETALVVLCGCFIWNKKADDLRYHFAQMNVKDAFFSLLRMD